MEFPTRAGTFRRRLFVNDDTIAPWTVRGCRDGNGTGNGTGGRTQVRKTVALLSRSVSGFGCNAHQRRCLTGVSACARPQDEQQPASAGRATNLGAGNGSIALRPSAPFDHGYPANQAADDIAVTAASTPAPRNCRHYFPGIRLSGAPCGFGRFLTSSSVAYERAS
jgi:hypothetical protein